MKLAIVGVNYAPEMTGIAPYTTGLAEGLQARGHDVTVITGLPHYPEWRIDERYRAHRRLTETIDGVTVERRAHYVPHRLTPRTRIAFELSFASSALRRPLNSFDLVLTVSPSLLCSAAVVARSRLARVPVGVIVHDLYGKAATEVHGFGGHAASAVANLEARVLASASGVAVIHDRFARTLAAAGVPPNKMTVLRNWTHVDPPTTLEGPERSAARGRFGWADDEVVVLHAGNMGVKQGLDNVVNAAHLAASAGLAGRVRFVLLGDGSQRDLLQQQGAGVPCLQFLDPLPAPEFSTALGAADVLLVNEKPGVADMAVPSKLTTYFASGRPVLAATDVTSSTAHEVHAARAGVIVAGGDAGVLLDAALRLAADHERAGVYATCGKRYSRNVLDQTSAIDRYEQWCRSMTEGTEVVRASARKSAHRQSRQRFDGVPARVETPAWHDVRPGQPFAG
jgi:colanic acid biosynthesis glycosyl transferase WcaI